MWMFEWHQLLLAVGIQDEAVELVTPKRINKYKYNDQSINNFSIELRENVSV